MTKRQVNYKCIFCFPNMHVLENIYKNQPHYFCLILLHLYPFTTNISCCIYTIVTAALLFFPFFFQNTLKLPYILAEMHVLALWLQLPSFLAATKGKYIYTYTCVFLQGENNFCLIQGENNFCLFLASYWYEIFLRVWRYQND